MRIITTAVICLFFSLLPSKNFAQVGIGTTTPKSILDIHSFDADNPSATDGILIPRVNVLPSSNPGSDQDGMLVYLTANDGSHERGFQYWNGSKNSWEALVSKEESHSDSETENNNSTIASYTRGVKIVNGEFANKNLNDFDLDLSNTSASVFILNETGREKQSVNITGIKGGTDGRVIT
ncbi:MAG: hypothetical protein V7767_12245, partial [Leeuwenhoekiella sp.]